jgi:hypothetical protein
MTADTYTVTRAGLYSEHITAQGARELYDAAAGRRLSELTGHLESGFASPIPWGRCSSRTVGRLVASVLCVELPDPVRP